jgi:hypothetical protein
MQLRKAERKRVKIKMALQGSAGSGKTMSSLLLAKGLTNNNLSKVAIIDSENGSSELYAEIGNYNVIRVSPPFTPEKYIKAIDICLEAKMEVIILDSISQVWEELIDFHSKLPGNSFTNWNKVTPRQKAFINKILQSNTHIIATMRTKQDYVLNQKNGKYIPEKVGLKAVQRDGVDFEFTLVFEIDIKHYAIASKDRTGLFANSVDFKISEATGRVILDWCNQGTSISDAEKEIAECTTVEGLRHLYQKYSGLQNELKDIILNRKQEIEAVKSMVVERKEIIHNNKTSENGINS